MKRRAPGTAIERTARTTTTSSTRSRRRLAMGAALAVAIGAIGAWPSAAMAQDYPTRPIRMIVPFPPGGGFDAIARPLAEKMSARLMQNVIVDNKAGAGGNIGTAEAARASADGYTILFANEILATNPNIYRQTQFDPLKDFAPVAMVVNTPLVLAVNTDLPARNLKELIALSAKEPITFGTPGMGTSPHLFGELLNLRTPLKLRHIPYRGSGPAITEAIGGQINAVLTVASGLTPHIVNGKLRGIAILSDKRSPLLPDLPTLAEGGIAGYTHDTWYSVMAPAGTPQPIIAKLREAIAASLQSPDLIERLRKMGTEPLTGDGAAVTQIIQNDLQRWHTVVTEARIEQQ